jgi:hypothetical protein
MGFSPSIFSHVVVLDMASAGRMGFRSSIFSPSKSVVSCAVKLPEVYLCVIVNPERAMCFASS